MKKLRSELEMLKHPLHGMKANFSISSREKLVVEWAMGPKEKQVLEICKKHSSKEIKVNRKLPWNLHAPLYAESHAYAWLMSKGLSPETWIGSRPAYEVLDLKHSGIPVDEFDSEIEYVAGFHFDECISVVPESVLIDWVNKNYPEGSTGLEQGEFVHDWREKSPLHRRLVDLSIPENATLFKQHSEEVVKNEQERLETLKREKPVLNAKDVKNLLALKSQATQLRFLKKKFGAEIAAEILDQV